MELEILGEEQLVLHAPSLKMNALGEVHNLLRAQAKDAARQIVEMMKKGGWKTVETEWESCPVEPTFCLEWDEWQELKNLVEGE